MRQILPAEERHIPDLLRLLRQINMIHHLGRPDLFKGPATKYSEAELKALLSSAVSRIFVCEEGDLVLGYAICELKEIPETALLHARKELYLDDLCVDEPFRGQGIGHLLFERVRAEAAVLGCHHLNLTVWSLNPSARRFYEACGMLPLKTTMELRLDPKE